MTEQIRDIFGPIFPGSEEESSQDAAQSFAAVTTVVGIKYFNIISTVFSRQVLGLPLATGLMSLFGVGPAVIIGDNIHQLISVRTFNVVLRRFVMVGSPHTHPDGPGSCREVRSSVMFIMLC